MRVLLIVLLYFTAISCRAQPPNEHVRVLNPQASYVFWTTWSSVELQTLPVMMDISLWGHKVWGVWPPETGSDVFLPVKVGKINHNCILFSHARTSPDVQNNGIIANMRGQCHKIFWCTWYILGPTIWVWGLLILGFLDRHLMQWIHKNTKYTLSTEC